MTTYHTTSIEIKYGTNTQGFFSFEKPKNLIVFVHGFGGDSTRTWNNFLSFILFDSYFKNSDIIFYGYDTFKGQASDHSSQLYDFLNLMNNPLKNNILPAQQQLPERNYQFVLLVAHSLGAVLVRQAQLLAYIENKKWVDKSRLALFAPAHNGAEIIPLATQALPGLSALLGIFAKFRYPILNDLNPSDNGILKAIKEQTNDLQRQGKAEFSKARLVIHARGDKIIKSYQYLLDKPAKIVENSNHVAVCKPKNGYSDPFECIKSIIK
ncbi:MAG: hypothetical protein JWR09_1239 [Mucilaginibacter sp.]|nr:hypothetical protein [Mucilaginibacter sp.]